MRSTLNNEVIPKVIYFFRFRRNWLQRSSCFKILIDLLILNQILIPHFVSPLSKNIRDCFHQHASFSISYVHCYILNNNNNNNKGSKSHITSHKINFVNFKPQILKGIYHSKVVVLRVEFLIRNSNVGLISKLSHVRIQLRFQIRMYICVWPYDKLYEHARRYVMWEELSVDGPLSA